MADEIIGQAREGLSESQGRRAGAAGPYVLGAIKSSGGDGGGKANQIAGEQGFHKIAAEGPALASSIDQAQGRSDEAAHADAAARSTQAAGDLVPPRSQALTELHLALGKYAEADQEFDRAEVLVDSSLAGSCFVKTTGVPGGCGAVEAVLGGIARLRLAGAAEDRAATKRCKNKRCGKG